MKRYVRAIFIFYLQLTLRSESYCFFCPNTSFFWVLYRRYNIKIIYFFKKNSAFYSHVENTVMTYLSFFFDVIVFYLLRLVSDTSFMSVPFFILGLWKVTEICYRKMVVNRDFFIRFSSYWTHEVQVLWNTLHPFA